MNSSDFDPKRTKQPSHDVEATEQESTINIGHCETGTDFHLWFDSVNWKAVREVLEDEHVQACWTLSKRLGQLDYVRSLAKSIECEEDLAEWALPKPMGQLVLEERLGSGGMGHVFKARHRQLGRIQVVKVLHAWRLGDVQAVARFRKEMRAVGQLSHPNIVTAHHADEDKGVPYLVMDYVDGHSLAQALRFTRKTGDSIPVPVACELIRQAAIGLQYAHERGIIHRDIKPANLMVDRSATVKILDLGLARMVGDRQGDTVQDLSSLELTEAHQILGTPDYMAPEQFRSSRDVDARADMYALGATLFTLLTGRVVFPSDEPDRPESPLEKAMRIVQQPVPDVRQVRADVPKKLAELVEQCLAKEPDERVASAGELAGKLAKWASADALSCWLDEWDEVERSSSPEPGPVTPSEPKSNDRQASPQDIVTSRVSATDSAVAPLLQTEGRRPSRRFLMVASAMLIPLLAFVLAAVYRLQLPDGGTLVIECDDPGAEITLSAVKDGRSRPLTLTQKNGRFTLSEGTWEIRVDGLEADRFELSEHHVTIASGQVTKLRVTRLTPEETPAAIPLAKTSPPSGREKTRKDDLPGTNATTPGSTAPTPSRPRPSDEELRRRLTTIDWNAGSNVINNVQAGILRVQGRDPGDWQATWIPGYASFPVTIPGQPFYWQVLPRLPHVRADGYQLSVSPHGTYLADSHHQTEDPYVRILERKTGRLVGIVPFHGRGFERRIAWAPDEHRLIVCTWIPSKWYCTVLRTDGTKLAEWSLGENFRDREGFSFSPHWSPDGKRILLMGRQMLEQRTPEGDLVETFVAPKFEKPIAAELWPSASSPHGPWSPSGDRFAVATGSEIRVYPADGGEPVAVLKDEEEGIRFGAPCFWHPSGRKIFTNQRGADGKPLGRLWTLDGAFVDFELPKLHEYAVGFSPDGRFLLTSHGEIRDLTDQVVSNLDVEKAGYVNFLTLHARWQEPGRLILFFTNNGSGHSAEYSPSGKKLAEYRHPVPILQNSMTWLPEQERFMTFGVKPGWTAKDPPWQLTWDTDDGKDSAVPLKFDDDYVKVMSFSPKDARLAIPVHSGTRILVYNSQGQRQYEMETASGTILTSWSPDGTLLATGGYEAYPHQGVIEVWRGPEKIATCKGHTNVLLGLVWDPTGSRLLSWDGDLNVFLWDVKRPDQPIWKGAGYGFKQGQRNIHWAFDRTCPRWSPSGKRLAVPTEQGVVIVSPNGEQETTIPVKKEDIRMIWWTPDEKQLIVGKTIYDLSGKETGRFGQLEDPWSIPFLFWLNGGRLVAGWHRGILFCDRVDGPVTEALSLPGFKTGSLPEVTLLSRGMNAVRVSPSEKYLLYSSALRPTFPESHGGDIHLIDLENRRHVWTGLAFDDGTQVRIEPTGRTRLGDNQSFDDYLVYVIRYENGHLVPLTELEFASRIGLSPVERFVQRVLDCGGSVNVAGRSEPLGGIDLRDARNLPPIDSVIGIDLSGIRSFQDGDLSGLERLTALEELDLSGTGVTLSGLRPLQELQSLRRLNLAGLEIDGKLSAYLPPGLEELDVRDTDVTDFLLYDLRGFQSLKRLDVRGTNVTPTGMEKLKQALPDCEVRYDKPGNVLPGPASGSAQSSLLIRNRQRNAQAEPPRTENSRSVSYGDGQAERKHTEILEQFERDLPEIRKYLVCYLSDGYKLRGQLSGKGPASLSELESLGFFEKGLPGLKKLLWNSTLGNDRPRGPLPGNLNAVAHEAVVRVQELLVEYGEILVEKKMLAP